MKEKEGLLRKILNPFYKQKGLNDLLEMSEHWDGHKRETAVHLLRARGNPVAIPKLIVRTNDWVYQVRNAAKDSLEKLLKNENAEAFVYCLPELIHLRNCGRVDHDSLIDKIISLYS